MLLVIEVGNTNTKVGVFSGPRLLVSWRLTTRREQTADEYGVFIQALLGTRGIEPQRITGVAISNVVPTVQLAIEAMSDTYFGVRPFTVEPGRSDTVPLAVEAPQEVGADRICDIVGGVTIYGPPLIVVNFGTATTFDCVNERGEFIGGAIAPGLVTASEALISRAARLYRVELLQPKEAIGRNTITNIQSGVMYGWAGLVDGLVARMRAEMGTAVKVVATGGLAAQMRGVARTVDVVNPDLTLEGLRAIWERAHPQEPARTPKQG
jgi:type III pantothenate kinase